MTVSSYEDLLARFERAVVLSQGSITVDAVRAAGSNINIVAIGAASMGQMIAGFAEREHAASFFSTAAKRQVDLERWAYDRYQLRPARASAAVVPITFARTDAATGFTQAAGTIVGTADGVLFETLNDVPFAAGQRGPIAVNAVAQAVGKAGNVALNTITTFISAKGDQTLVVRNLERAAGGTEGQTKEEFASVVQSFYVSAQSGTLLAIRAAVLAIPGVAQAFVDEMLDGNGDPAGIVQIVISDASGGGNTVLSARVLAGLRTKRGLGVPALVTAGSPVFIDIEAASLSFRAGYDSTDVLAEARTRVLAVVNALSPNETLRRADIISALRSTPGLLVADDSLAEPAGDYVPATGEVIRTTGDRVVLNGTVGAAA